MEKRPAVAKSVNKLLRLLPKAAQASVSFQNPHYSPGRDKRPDHKLKIGFSGAIVSMIPAEAREKTNRNFETQEPTSPKISCIGQIKHKNKLCSKKKLKEFNPAQPEKISKARSVGTGTATGAELKKKPAGIKKMFSVRRNSVDASVDHSKPPLPDRAPSLSHMRKFASSRDTLAHFDWTTTTTTTHVDHYLCSDEDTDGEDDCVIPFSAPILVLEPRKEINLWRRRTMPQPKPLQLNIVRANNIKENKKE